MSIVPAAWLSRPPSACLPSSVRCSSVRPGSARMLTSSRQKLTLWWQPLPIIPVAGLGMKLAVMPSSRATCLQIWR